jgi:hypothetical protein
MPRQVLVPIPVPIAPVLSMVMMSIAAVIRHIDRVGEETTA